MLHSHQYDAFARALATRCTRLRTSSAAYWAAHELPGWYDLFRDHAPRSEQLITGLDKLGAEAAVLRDHVKSAEHDWHEAAYLPDTSDRGHVAKVAQRLLELRGDDFVGGFVARAYEPFTGSEVRTWWIAGESRLATAHPDTPDAVPAPGTVDPSP
jgi:ATP-grasp domain, R2K clade family 3